MYVTQLFINSALKAFKLGGNSNFGASTDVGFGLKYEADNGFAMAQTLLIKTLMGKWWFPRRSVSKWDTHLYTQPGITYL